MDADIRREVLKRWAYICGHLGGVRGMVEGDARCVDVARQTYAIRRAIRKVESEILAEHVKQCVGTAIASRRADDPALNELIDLYEFVAR